MKKNANISIRLIESAYRQKFRFLFSCAYLITGNERKAEGVIMKVILAHPIPDEKDFDQITEEIKAFALKDASHEDNAIFSFSGDMSEVKTPLGESILTLDEKKARTLVLRYALDLSVKEIAHLTGDRPDKVKATLEIGKQRATKGSKSPRGALNALHIACREVLETACYPPDFSAVMRSIERIIEDKNARNERSFSVKPMLSWLITGILMVFTALIIWMTVVLIDYFRAPVKALSPIFPAYTQSPENTEG